MYKKENFSLKDLNTFQVEAYTDQYVRFDTEDEIINFLTDNPANQNQYLVLGGGSNLLFLNDCKGIILHPVLKGIEVVQEHKDYVLVKVMAGEVWDDLVAHTVANGWGGLENLSHIPGSVGASAVQNIGAYGVEVKTVIDIIEAVSIQDQKKVTIYPQECGYAYRYSHFKDKWKGQFIITSVVFKLLKNPELITHYPGIKDAVEKLGPRNLENMRKAIISMRQSKLPDPAKIGNVGSFFKNPIVTDKELQNLLKIYSDLPHYPHENNQFKLAAGWLIEKCGWKGKKIGNAAVHDQQALVLVNLGGATGREIYDLSEQIRESVLRTFNVNLEREVMVVR